MAKKADLELVALFQVRQIIGSVRFAVGLRDPKGLFQPKRFCGCGAEPKLSQNSDTGAGELQTCCFGMDRGSLFSYRDKFTWRGSLLQPLTKKRGRCFPWISSVLRIPNVKYK